jgi:hypothetical protein
MSRRFHHPHRGVVDDGTEHHPEGHQDDVVRPPQGQRLQQFVRAAHRLCAPDAFGGDLENPPEHQRQRKPQQARPQQITDRSIGDAPGGKENVGRLKQQPDRHHIDARETKYTPAAQLLQETDHPSVFHRLPERTY